MKNFIIKLFAWLFIVVGFVMILGLLVELSDGTANLEEDWLLTLFVIFIPLGLGVSLLRINNISIGNILLAHSVNKNEKMVNNNTKFEDAIATFDAQYDKKKSSNIYVLDDITQDFLTNHKKKHKMLGIGEKPLLILNTKKTLLTKLFPFTGFVITDKNIYFATLKRAFVTGVLPFKEKPSSIPLEYVTSFQIGEHDSCFGTAYVGHDLMINGQKLGLVRLGYGFTYDDKALEYINELSKYLFEQGFFYEKPQKFAWQ